MASTYQRRIKIYNGTDYDEFHPLTDASVVNMSDGTTVENKLKMYTTTNSGNAYSVTIPNLASLTDGLNIRVKFNVASTGAITLNINSLGAKSVKDYFGNSVTNVRANLPANLVYESTSSSFILLGKGGGGNATADHLLVGDTATVDSGPIAGAMPNNGAITITPSTTDQAISLGYHNGQGKVVGDANLASPNILKGKSIFNIAGGIDLSNLTPDNVKENVNINGVVGTLEEKQDLYPGVVNFASNQNTYKAVSYIKGEGLYCSESANKCYLFNNAGTLIKTITVSYNSYTLYPVSVTKNHILWTGQGTDGVLLSDKNGTTIVGESDSRLNGLIDEDNNKLYLENVLSGNCIIYCKDFNLNNLGEQTVVSGSAFGIIPMSTDILVLAKNSSNVVGLYYVNISSNVTIKLAYGDYAFNLLASI